MRVERVAGFGYAVAVAAVVVTALLVAAARGSFISSAPFVVFLLPVMLGALIGGFGPGLLATGLGCIALSLPFAGTGVAASAAAGLPLVLFGGVGALASWLIGLRPRTLLALGRADRVLVERALRQSEARYRAIVDSQSEMVCRFRPDGEILFVNGGYARARGTTPEELVGQNFWHFITEEDQATVREMLARLTPEAPEVRIENRFETVEGIRWTLWTNRALGFDDAGRWIEAQSTGIDITDRKEAEQALLEASRRKNEFLAILGHELRNPLAPLSAGLELLRKGDGAPDKVDIVRAMMTRQLEHLTRLVEDLLDLSRISRGDISLRKMPIDLRKVIDDAVELTRPSIGERGHRLVIDLPPKALAIDADFQRLVQVVANLLSNAAKYTEPGGTIDILAEEGNGQAVIRVRDTGYGFPPDQCDLLFEMFAQIEEHRARTGGGGLGIGLALSRQLVEQHGGTIEAQSAGLEHGSEFIVRLPLSKDSPVALSVHEAPPEIEAGATGATGRRILVVDDNVDAAESLGLVLEFEGHSVRVEHEPLCALEAVRTFEPEVVLLDIGLPGMDGYQLARRIRQLPVGQRALLIAITGWGQSTDRERALEAGFDEHLPKPVDWQGLTALIESDVRWGSDSLVGRA